MRKTIKSFSKVLSVLLAVIMVVSIFSMVPEVYGDEFNATVANVTSVLNVRSAATTTSSVVTQITNSTRVKILEEVDHAAGDTSGCAKWFKIEVKVNNNTVTGYVASSFITRDATPAPTTSPTPTTSTTPTTSPTPAPAAPTATPPAPATTTTAPMRSYTGTYDSLINDFPDAYKTRLQQLHEAHPNWVFHADYTGIDWTTILDLETQKGVSLVENTADASWRSQTWTEVADSGRWVNASRAIVAYYLDPRNSLDEANIFQFMDLNYNDGSLSEDTVNRVLNGTFMAYPQTALYNNDTTRYTYAQLFSLGGNNAASGTNGINPVFIAAHARMECGSRGSASSNGATGYYNFYNIGAYSDAVNATRHGLALAQFGLDQAFNEAYEIQWNTPGRSIIGGARWIYNNYTAKGQSTLYYMRFNTAPNRSYNVAKHQYMTAIASCSSEGKLIYNAYKDANLLNGRIDFYIPVYTGMPAEASPLPTPSTVFDDFVVWLYNNLMGRTASAAEVSDHSTQLMNGTKACDLIYNNFVTSAEFRARNLSDADYVRVLFTTLLNRAPTDAEINNYTGLVAQGYTRAEIYKQIVNSDECKTYLSRFSINLGTFTNPDFVDNHMDLRPFVNNLYREVLGRDPDIEGLRNWINVLASGQASGPNVTANFCMSAEMNNLNLDNTEFVRRLYRVCLGRDADEAGLNSWVNLLNQHYTREYVVAGFVNSQEFLAICNRYHIGTGAFSPASERRLTPDEAKIRAFVTRLYDLALNRAPDTDGLNAWTNTLMNGNNGYDVAHGFIFSNEMIGQNLSNEEFLNRLYRIFLDREPDTDGFNAWLGQLNSGVSRQEIFEGFVYSPEFAQKCIDAGFAPTADFHF